MTDEGFVLIYRTLLGHPAFRNDGEALAFAWMVLRASWRPVRVRYKGRPISLDRGQLAVSVRDLAENLDRPKGWIERLLKRLKSETMIKTHSETGVLVITVCNYNDYQAELDRGRTVGETPDETPAGQAQDSRRTQNKEGNKGTREQEGSDEPSPPAPQHIRGKGWPEIPDWVPVEAWNGFIEMRRRKKANPTPRAVSLLLKEIEKLRRKGNDPGAVLDQSTVKNWTDVYALKDNRNGSGNRNQDNRDGFTRAIDRSLGRDGAEVAAGEDRRRDAGDGGEDRRLPLTPADADR